MYVLPPWDQKAEQREEPVGDECSSGSKHGERDAEFSWKPSPVVMMRRRPSKSAGREAPARWDERLCDDCLDYLF